MCRVTMRFGLFIPQGRRLDLVGIDPAGHWRTMKRLALQAEAGPWESIGCTTISPQCHKKLRKRLPLAPPGLPRTGWGDAKLIGFAETKPVRGSRVHLVL